MVRTRASFKLDVRSQKAQCIYNNTSNSLTGASASSGGAIQYATTLTPKQPNASGTSKNSRAHQGKQNVKICSCYFRGAPEKGGFGDAYDEG